MGNMTDFKHSCSSAMTNSLVESKSSCHMLRQEGMRFREGESMRLSHFRSSLLKPECFFVLNTLLQQYYMLFRQYGKVVVSDQLCQVTKFGEVKVDFQIDGPQTPLNLYNHVVNIVVTMVSQILETVTVLAVDKSWLESKECSYFQQRFTKIIYQYHSFQEKMYQELQKEINSYMQRNRIKCNLIPAIIRKQENIRSTMDNNPLFYHYEHNVANHTPYLAHSRSRSQSELMNSSERPPFSYSSDVSEHEEPSTFVRIRDSSTKVGSHFEHNIRTSLSKPSKSKKTPLYRHKMVRTEGQTYFNNCNKTNFKDYRNLETYLSEMPPTERPAEQAHLNKIASQYSINILSTFAKNKKVNMTKNNQKVKFKQFDAKSKNSSSSSGYDFSSKKKTSIQALGSQITQKNSKMYSRSVLDDLARSISVQEEPTSREHIN